MVLKNSCASIRCRDLESCTLERVQGGPLEEPAAVILHGGVCEGETPVSHGGLKRAQNGKPWIQPKKA